MLNIDRKTKEFNELNFSLNLIIKKNKNIKSSKIKKLPKSHLLHLKWCKFDFSKIIASM